MVLYGKSPQEFRISSAGLGALLLGIGVWTLNINIDKIHKGIIARAEVTRLEKKVGHNTMYTPVIKFTTRDGQIINTKLNVSSSTPPYDIGDKVNVIYLPSQPADVIVDTPFEKYGFSIIFIAIGSFSILGGIIGRLRRPRSDVYNYVESGDQTRLM